MGRSVRRLTGLSANTVLGKTAHDILPPSFWVDTYENNLKTNQPIHFESYFRQFDRYLEVSVFCPKAGQCATIIEDITERKRAELAILKINEVLEERVRLRTAELVSHALDEVQAQALVAAIRHARPGADVRCEPISQAEGLLGWGLELRAG